MILVVKCCLLLYPLLFLLSIANHSFTLLLGNPMALGEDKVSFREPSQEVPFIMTVGKEDYIDVDKRLLCLRFNFKDGNLMLVEREEFDEDMVLMLTIYQKPRTSSGVWRYQVTLGHYVV